MNVYFTRSRHLEGWIGGGWARKASGYMIGRIYPDRESAEAETEMTEEYPLVRKLSEVMFGDTPSISYADFREAGATEDEIIEAESLGWFGGSPGLRIG